MLSCIQVEAEWIQIALEKRDYLLDIVRYIALCLVYELVFNAMVEGKSFIINNVIDCRWPTSIYVVSYYVNREFKELYASTAEVRQTLLSHSQYQSVNYARLVFFHTYKLIILWS